MPDAPDGPPEWSNFIDTPTGPARLVLAGRGPRGLLLLGHGAGGGLGAPDLVAVSAAAVEAGWTVYGVDQPYRVAGRRAPAPAASLDRAWDAVVSFARTLVPGELPLVTGGRSSGARVACRTARSVGAVGVVALAFPLRPPKTPQRSRAHELDAGVPVLVVQGERDPFGGPGDVENERPAGVEVVGVPGEHSLRAGVEPAAAAVVAWLADRWRESVATALG